MENDKLNYETKKEKVPLLLVYKQDGIIKLESSADSRAYELYGFLNCYLAGLEAELIGNISKSTGKDSVLD